MKRATENRALLELYGNAENSTIEGRATSFIRDALAPGEPDAACLARMHQRLTMQSSKRVRPRFALRFAVVGIALVVGVASVGAYELARSAGWFGPTLPAASSPPSPSQGAKKPARTGMSPSPVSLAEKPADDLAVEPAVEPPPPTGEPDVGQPAPAAQPGPLARDLGRSKRQPSGRMAFIHRSLDLPPPSVPSPSAAPVPATPGVGNVAPKAPASPTSDEIQSLDLAFRLLRRDRNGVAALAAFDAYLVRFPMGVLNQEARLARIDALLMLHRTDEALAALESLPLDGGRRMAHLLLVRGELRARTNCAGALEDFTAALARSPDATMLERILYGRGACRAQLGDRAGATSDLRRYVERFPDGAHARWARSWLETAPKNGAGE